MASLLDYIKREIPSEIEYLNTEARDQHEAEQREDGAEVFEELTAEDAFDLSTANDPPLATFGDDEPNYGPNGEPY